VKAALRAAFLLPAQGGFFGDSGHVKYTSRFLSTGVQVDEFRSILALLTDVAKFAAAVWSLVELLKKRRKR